MKPVVALCALVIPRWPESILWPMDKQNVDAVVDDDDDADADIDADTDAVDDANAYYVDAKPKRIWKINFSGSKSVLLCTKTHQNPPETYT